MQRAKKVTLSSLKECSVSRTLRNYVVRLVSEIDGAIAAAYTKRSDSLVFSLPTVFDLDSQGVPVKDIQLFVYSEILGVYNTPEEQGGRGLSAKIAHSDGDVSLVVSWPTPEIMSSRERKTRKDIIAKYSTEPSRRP